MDALLKKVKVFEIDVDIRKKFWMGIVNLK